MPYRPDTSAPTRAAALVASALSIDAVLHLYRTTGATWLAADDGNRPGHTGGVHRRRATAAPRRPDPCTRTP